MGLTIAIRMLCCLSRMLGLLRSCLLKVYVGMRDGPGAIYVLNVSEIRDELVGRRFSLSLSTQIFHLVKCANEDGQEQGKQNGDDCYDAKQFEQRNTDARSNFG